MALAWFWLGCTCPEAELVECKRDYPDSVPVDVIVVVPDREDLDRRVVLSADVRALETTTVYSKVSGYLSSIEVDIGDRVNRGQLIAKLEVPELRDQLREAEAALDAAQANHARAAAELEGVQADAKLQEKTYKRLRAVRAKMPVGMPQQTVDEARAAYRRSQAAVKAIESRLKFRESAVRRAQATMQRRQTLIAYAEIRAPLNGIVTERFVDPGALLQAATSTKTVQRIVTVANMDRVRLLADVPESEVRFVEAGDPAVLTVDALPGREFVGEVTRFALALDPATRTMRTEIELENPGWLLRPGMYGQVALSLAISSNAITVPAEALRADGDRSFVYCIVGGIAKRVEVEAAIRVLDYTFPHSTSLTQGWREATARKKQSGTRKDPHRCRKCCLNNEIEIEAPLRFRVGQRMCVRNGPAVSQEQCDPTRTKQSEFQHRDGVKAEVTSGLEGHEQVVVSARRPIADGVQVNVVKVWP